MKLKNIQDIEAFKAAVNSCEGAVWLESPKGDRFDLKSMFSQYLAIGKLLADKNEELELYAANADDEMTLIDFLIKHE